MTKQTVNVGTVANDGTGDPLRSAFEKTNANFDEVYTGLGDGTALATGLTPFVAADRTKLDGIEPGATADMTGAEIKAAYEAQANTNAYTDAEKTKLAGVETGATADMTAGEIKTAYESNGDTNAFTDAEKSQLAGLEASLETTTINAQTGTAYILAIGDRGQTVTMTNAAANTVTIPTNASVSFQIGSVVSVLQTGAGATTISAAAGVTINGVSAGSGTIGSQWQGVSLLKTGTDAWVVSGDIGAIA